MNRKLVVQQFLTLDGVMQAPGAKDEDTRGGFEHGGWQLPFYDGSIVEFMLDRYARADALLFGRRTYETFAAYWPTAPDDGNPFVKEMNRLIKYVASNHPVDLGWKTSIRIEPPVPEAVRQLKEQPGNDILVLGSGNLVQTLLEHRLVDELVLIVAPLVLGTGKRLFGGNMPRQEFVLAGQQASSTGVSMLTYAIKPQQSG